MLLAPRLYYPTKIKAISLYRWIKGCKSNVIHVDFKLRKRK